MTYTAEAITESTPHPRRALWSSTEQRLAGSAVSISGGSGPLSQTLDPSSGWSGRIESRPPWERGQP